MAQTPKQNHHLTIYHGEKSKLDTTEYLHIISKSFWIQNNADDFCLLENNAKLTAQRWNSGCTASRCPGVPLLNTYGTHIVVRVAGMLQGRTEGGRSTVLQEQDSRICTQHNGLDRRWAAVHVARMGENRNAYAVLVRIPAVKWPLGRSRRRRKDNIKVTVIVWLRIRINVVLFNTVINLQFVTNMRGIAWLAGGTISFSRTLPHVVS
jgi:hypothetical protein